MHKNFSNLLLVLLFSGTVCISGCGLLKEKPAEERAQTLPGVTGKPIPPEKAQELLKGMGGDWLYGEGLGDTAINLGTAVVFPPYALVLLGNGVLSLSGYEPIHFSDALPEEQSQVWKETYSELASAPGRVAAAAAGKEFRTEERIQTEMKQRLQQLQEAQVDDKAGKIK